MKCQSLEKHTTRREKVTPVLHIDTHSSMRAHSQQWWMAITSLSVLRADRVFILMSKHCRDQGQSEKLDWWGEIFKRGLEKKGLHLKSTHMSGVVNCPINSSLRLCPTLCVSLYRPMAVEQTITFPWCTDGRVSSAQNKLMHVFKSKVLPFWKVCLLHCCCLLCDWSLSALLLSLHSSSTKLAKWGADAVGW